MAEIQLGAVEARFADIIWEREPVSSTELTKLAAAAFTWKRTTTHMVLRRLCDKGLFQNNDGTVTSLLSRQEFYARHSKKYVDETFDGSLPAFFAAFTSGKKLTRKKLPSYINSLTRRVNPMSEIFLKVLNMSIAAS